MPVLTEREKVHFISGDTECAAWHYPATNGACVIMTGGFAVTKEPGTDLFAKRFTDAGFAVLAFDYRRLGESGGQPRQVVRIRALLSTPDALNGGKALDWGNRYPDWQQAAAARSALRLGFYRPGRYASRVRCPLLVVVCDQDQTALAGPAAAAADHAPRGELVRLPGGHYQPFLDGHERAVEAELSFLRQHLLDHPRAERPAPAPAVSAPQRGGRA